MRTFVAFLRRERLDIAFLGYIRVQRDDLNPWAMYLVSFVLPFCICKFNDLRNALRFEMYVSSLGVTLITQRVSYT